jgi:hypothetical protein
VGQFNAIGAADEKIIDNPETPDMLSSRVARWFVFKPKIPIWVNFGGP